MEETGKRIEGHTLAVAASAVLVASVLGNDDLLREILLRLDFPTCLVRAAAVSKRWLRHASDPAFLRRFRHLHPPRLLGFYARPQIITPPRLRRPQLRSSVQMPQPPEYAAVFRLPQLRFVQMPQPPEYAAVIRRSSLEVIYDGRDVSDCRNGRLVFVDDYPMSDFALFSPLHTARGTTTLPQLQIPAAIRNGEGSHSKHVLLPEDGGDAMPCTAVSLMFAPVGVALCGMCAHLSELQAGAWCEGRTSDLFVLPGRLMTTRPLLLAHGKLYMTCLTWYILGLDLLSMSFFTIKLPDGVARGHVNLALCRAEGSGLFLIHVKGFQIDVWIHRTGCSTGNWELVDSICLHQVFGRIADPTWLAPRALVRVAAAGDNANFVFLGIGRNLFYMHIRSRAVEKVYESQVESNFDIHPFMMVWPPTFPTLE